MTYHDKIQLTIIIVAPPDQVAEGDRIFRSHAPWMEATHYRTGDKALLSYNVSKGPELSNPNRGQSSPELQRVQGAGALESDGSQLCPDRKHVLRPVRDL
jgi:hypothetical protein